MLPTGELLLIPSEWLQRYTELLLIGMPKGKGFYLQMRNGMRGEKLFLQVLFLVQPVG